jgi:Phosphotransferase enzyme family
MPMATIPTALAALDAGWFDRALPPTTDGGAPRAPVAAVSVEPLAIAGAAGELARVRLRYEAGAAGPASVIAKFRGTSPTQRAMDGALGIFDRERRFYLEAAPLLPVAAPRCHHGGDGHRTPLLLEDLCSLRTADQVTGLPLKDAERLMDVLGDLHAAFWEQPIPGGPEWTVSLSDPTFAGMLTQLVTSGVPALRQRYEGRVPAGLLTSIEDAAPGWATVLARCDEGPRTLVHNDCRSDNIFFRPGGEPVFIDWQLPAHSRGTQDVAYLLSGSLEPGLLREHWEPLLARYHRRLGTLGVLGYSWEQCVVHYRQSLLYTLGPGIALLGAMAIAGDERGLADTLVLRTLTHAADLDAFGTL